MCFQTTLFGHSISGHYKMSAASGLTDGNQIFPSMLLIFNRFGAGIDHSFLCNSDLFTLS